MLASSDAESEHYYYYYYYYFFFILFYFLNKIKCGMARGPDHHARQTLHGKVLH